MATPSTTVEQRLERIEGRFDNLDRGFDMFRSYANRQFTRIFVEMATKEDIRLLATSRELDTVNLRLDSLGQRVGGFDKRIGKLEQRIGKVEQRIGKLEQRIGKLEQRIGELERRIGSLDQRIDSVEHRIDKIDVELAAIRSTLEGVARKKDLERFVTKKEFGELTALVVEIAKKLDVVIKAV